jgi:ribosomal protein S18 acetylase RimI-like enzyme
MRIRLATQEDVPALVRVINRAYHVEAFFKAGDRTDASQIAELLAKDAFLVAEDEGGVAGAVYVKITGERGYFGMLSVDPSRQRGGLGRALVEAAERHCRDRGCTIMDLVVVNLRIELPPIYRKLGYEETGTAPFPDLESATQPCHLITMSKPLR